MDPVTVYTKLRNKPYLMIRRFRAIWTIADLLENFLFPLHISFKNNSVQRSWVQSVVP